MATKKRQLQAFGKIVRHLRTEAGLSQEGLASRAGIHRTYIGGIERGERNPTLMTIHRLAIALGVRPSQLLEDPPEPKAQRDT